VRSLASASKLEASWNEAGIFALRVAKIMVNADLRRLESSQ